MILKIHSIPFHSDESYRLHHQSRLGGHVSSVINITFSLLNNPTLHLCVVVNALLDVSLNLGESRLGSRLLVGWSLGDQSVTQVVSVSLQVVEVGLNGSLEAVGLEVALLGVESVDGLGDVGFESLQACQYCGVI